MARDARREIHTLCRRIAAADRGGNPADRAALLCLSDNLDLLQGQLGDHRHIDLLRRSTIMSENVGGLHAVPYDRTAAKRILRWINQTYENEHTNQNYRKELRLFARYVDEIHDEVPEPVAWVPTSTSADFNPRPSERDLITHDEHLELIEATRNPRDAALVAVQFEAGLRAGELLSLQLGDVFDAEHSVGLHVDGKTGERVVHLSIAVPQLQRWESEHPGGPDDPLWSKLTEPTAISDAMVRKTLRRAGERAGIDKPMTPTNFRKSNTRFLFKLGLRRAQIEQRQGRAHNSKHTARYEAEFGADALEATYASLHGADVEDAGASLDVEAPVPCPRCGRQTPAAESTCMHCQASLDVEHADMVEEVTSRLEEEAVETGEFEFLAAARRVRRTSRELSTERLHELASSMSSESDG